MENMNEKMFQTYNGDTYYRRENGTWFVENDNKRLMVGWKCIGSIDFSNIPREYIEDPELIVEEKEEQLQDGPPIDFVPYFKMGHHPLTIKKGRNEYIFDIGAAIIDVYRWI